MSATANAVSTPDNAAIDFDSAVEALASLRSKPVVVECFSESGNLLFEPALGKLGRESWGGEQERFCVHHNGTASMTTFGLAPATFAGASLNDGTVRVYYADDDGYRESFAVRPA